MHIRQATKRLSTTRYLSRRTIVVAAYVVAFGVAPCGAQAVVDTGAVVTLPGIHSSAAAPGCAETQGTGAASLSFECLNRNIAPGHAAPRLTQEADIGHRPTNQWGLYNAAALGHRMGPSLGNGVQPYRPRVDYPSPLVPSH